MSSARFAVLAGLRAGRRMSLRGFHSTSRSLAAQNFTMPALSPTMTEGGIAQWRVTEGQKFQAGDVLLEIETDKATMDVEAQDEGIMVKIFAPSGSKGVAVGTRIGVVAEADDDLSTLEIPAEPTAAATAASTSAPAPAASTPAPPKPAAPKGAVAAGTTPAANQTLLPSVLTLVHAHHIDKATLNTIPATGPAGRLTKGDILAHLGSISSDAPGLVKARFDTLSKLDLSNIKPAAKPEPKPAAAPAAAEPAAPAEPEELEVALPVSLVKVLETQKKLREALGVALPLSTFISRAAEVANDDLPTVPVAPSADELFDAVLGVARAEAPVSRGFYVPQVEALADTAPVAKAKELDIYDILAGKKPRKAAVGAHEVAGLNPANNLFSLVVPSAEAERASVFLERVKVILEKEPARLVL